MSELEEFMADRNEFLQTRNPTAAFCRAWFAKWNPNERQPAHDIGVLAGFYKARLGWTKCPKELQDEAKAWLTENGLTLEPYPTPPA